MRIHRKTSVPAPTLFPFLSVLVCLMGTLIFFAAALSVTTLEQAATSVEFELETGQRRKAPVVLECSHGIAKSLDGQLVFNKWVEGTDDISTPFVNFLNQMNAKKEYILFMVRPNGLDIFSRLRYVIKWRNRRYGQTNSHNECIANCVDYGSELIPAEWKIQVTFDSEQPQSRTKVEVQK